MGKIRDFSGEIRAVYPSLKKTNQNVPFPLNINYQSCIHGTIIWFKNTDSNEDRVSSGRPRTAIISEDLLFVVPASKIDT